MKISKEQVATIARLARLDLDDARLERFAGQFGDILDYMDMLGAVDTTDVEPLYSPSEHGTVLRTDEVLTHCTREQLLANAPESDGQFFVVPRIV